MYPKEQAKNDLMFLIQKLNKKDEDSKHISIAVIEERIESIINNIVKESASYTIKLLQQQGKL